MIMSSRFNILLKKDASDPLPEVCKYCTLPQRLCDKCHQGRWKEVLGVMNLDNNTFVNCSIEPQWRQEYHAQPV